MANKILIRRGVRTNLPVLSVGELALCTDTKELYIGTGSGNIKVGENIVQSVNGKTGTITLTFEDVGAAAKGHSHPSASTGTAGFVKLSTSTSSTSTSEAATSSAVKSAYDLAVSANSAVSGLIFDINQLTSAIDISGKDFFPVTLFDIDEKGKVVRNEDGDGEFIAVCLPNGGYKLRKIGRID